MATGVTRSRMGQSMRMGSSVDRPPAAASRAAPAGGEAANVPADTPVPGDTTRAATSAAAASVAGVSKSSTPEVPVKESPISVSVDVQAHADRESPVELVDAGMDELD